MKSVTKECEICGFPIRVKYWKIKIDEKILDVCPSCKEVYKDKAIIISTGGLDETGRSSKRIV
jgi:ribosome-binding protein aMBF1 (putative translation factor)